MNWKDRKSGFWNILPIVEKIPKWTPKKLKISTQNIHSILIWVQIWICVEIILLLEVWARRSKLKVQGMDSYPVNKNYVYIDEGNWGGEIQVYRRWEEESDK